MELDEVEMRFYGTDSIDKLSHAFQQITLSPRLVSPSQLSQQALNKSVGFIASTLQSCRDIHGHTYSSSREARSHEFIERVQNLRLQPPAVQNLNPTTPCTQTQVNPRYSRESHDSGIASFAESDTDLGISWELHQGCSDLGKTALLSVRSTALPTEKKTQFGETPFGMHVVIYFRLHRFSQSQAGPSIESPGPATTSDFASTTPCFRQGIYSFCPMAEYEPMEAHVGQRPKHATGRENVSSTEVDAYTFDEAYDTEATAAWTLYDTKQKHLDQQTHDLTSADVDPETPSTQPLTPHYPYSDADFVSAEEDTEVQYERLVESITNLVVKSDWIGHLEDDSVPVVQCTHAYLENIQNHKHVSDTTGKLPVSISSLCADGNNPGLNRGGQEASGGANGIRKRKQGGGHGNRHGKSDDGDGNPDEHGPEDFDDTEDWARDKKRARVDGRQRFPCPYRRRHTTRFNVRKHTQCALNTFESMALLK